MDIGLGSFVRASRLSILSFPLHDFESLMYADVNFYMNTQDEGWDASREGKRTRQRKAITRDGVKLSRERETSNAISRD